MHERNEAAIQEVLRSYRGGRIRAALRLAAQRDPIALPQYHPQVADKDHPPSPRFPTPLRKLNQQLAGGLYGVTSLAGEPKLGKSTLAIGVALEAAVKGWLVLFLSAEMAIEQTMARFGRYLAAHPHTDDPGRRLAILDVVTPMTSHRLVAELSDRVVEYGDERVLVVVDSLNSLAQMLGGDYFSKLHALLLFFVRARRLAADDLAVLAISELNQRGEVKGQQAAYWADCVVRLRRGNDHPGAVEVDVQHSREGGAGDLGRYVLDPSRGVFVPTAGHEGRNPCS